MRESIVGQLLHKLDNNAHWRATPCIHLSLIMVTLFSRVIRGLHLGNVHMLARIFSEKCSHTKKCSHTRKNRPSSQSPGSQDFSCSLEALGRQCPGLEMWPRPDIFTSVTSDMWQMPPNLIFSCENLTPCETWLHSWYFHTQKINVSTSLTSSP